MPFCPECRYEYEDDIKVCADCGKSLVKTLKDETGKEEEIPNVKFIPLPGLPGRVYAEMIKEVFEKEGIPCYIRSGGITDGFNIDAAGPAGENTFIYVPEDRVEECERIQHQMLDHI